MKGLYFFEIGNKTSFDFRDKRLLLTVDGFDHILLNNWILILWHFMSKFSHVQLFKMSGYLCQIFSRDFFENTVVYVKIQSLFLFNIKNNWRSLKFIYDDLRHF